MTQSRFAAGELQGLAQNGFRQRRQLNLYVLEIEIAGQIRNRHTQEFLLAEGSNGVEARFEILARANPARQFVGEIGGGAAHVREIGSHQRIENLRVADEERREVAT